MPNLFGYIHTQHLKKVNAVVTSLPIILLFMQLIFTTLSTLQLCRTLQWLHYDLQSRLSLLSCVVFLPNYHTALGATLTHPCQAGAALIHPITIRDIGKTNLLSWLAWCLTSHGQARFPNSFPQPFKNYYHVLMCSNKSWLHYIAGYDVSLCV